MNDLIACCSCRNVPNKAKVAFEMYFEGATLPEMFVGINEIRKMAEQLNPDWNITKYLLALAKSKEKYAYYFVFDGEDGDVTLQFDLLKGKKVF